MFVNVILRDPITVLMKISVKTQYLCVQNVFIMLGLRLGKGGNKSRQQDGMCSLNLKTLNLGFFFPCGMMTMEKMEIVGSTNFNIC
jgi:hypothetical protein